MIEIDEQEADNSFIHCCNFLVITEWSNLVRLKRKGLAKKRR